VGVPEGCGFNPSYNCRYTDKKANAPPEEAESGHCVFFTEIFDRVHWNPGYRTETRQTSKSLPAASSVLGRKKGLGLGTRKRFLKT